MEKQAHFRAPHAALALVTRSLPDLGEAMRPARMAQKTQTEPLLNDGPSQNSPLKGEASASQSAVRSAWQNRAKQTAHVADFFCNAMMGLCFMASTISVSGANTELPAGSCPPSQPTPSPMSLRSCATQSYLTLICICSP